MSLTSSLLRRSSWLLGVAATAALVGCASGPTTYTTSVQSYSSMAGIKLPTTYRIELLPSQLQNPQNFALVQNAAQQALANVGLQAAKDPSQAQLVVQIDAINVANTVPSTPDAGFYGPPAVYGWGFGRPWGPGPWGGPDMGMGWSMDFPTTIFHRSVNIVMRDAKTQRIVYETSSQNNNMLSNNPAIWGVLFNTALNDFPNPPQGVRQVQTTLTPAAPTTATQPAAAAK